MEKTAKFTKDHSAAIKGVAIFMLLCFHCFSDKSRLYGYEVSFWPFDQAAFMHFCRPMSICVGMFVFISAYGLTVSLKKQFKDYQFTAHEATMWVLKRYLSLFFLFLIPYIFCAGITFVTDTSRYSYGPAFSIISAILDLFGVSHLFGAEMMVNTWWYVSLIVFVTVFMPFMVRFYSRYSWLIIPMCLIPGSFWLEKHVHLTKYLFVVPLAICFADQRVFERFKEFTFFSKRWLDKLFRFIVLTAVLIVLWKLYNSSFGMAKFEFVLNGLTPLAMIMWCYEFLIDIPVLKQILVFLGNHSANIFYVHTFIRAMWLRDLTYSLKYIAVIYLFVLGLSVVISLFLEGVKKLIRYQKLTQTVTGKIVTWADKTL